MLSILSILCHFHGLLWKRATQNQNPAKAFLNAGTAGPNRFDERIGDYALIDLASLERIRIPAFDTDRVSAENVFGPVDVHGKFQR
jgi:hypothetical protein